MNQIRYQTANVLGLDIYSKAGPKDALTVLLLHQLSDLIAHVPQHPRRGEPLNKEEPRKSVLQKI